MMLSALPKNCLQVLQPSVSTTKTYTHRCTINKDVWNSGNWTSPAFIAEGLKWHVKMTCSPSMNTQLYLELAPCNNIHGSITTTASAISGKDGSYWNQSLTTSNMLEPVMVTQGFSYQYQGLTFNQIYNEDDAILTTQIKICNNIFGVAPYAVCMELEYTLSKDMEYVIDFSKDMEGSDFTIVVPMVDSEDATNVSSSSSLFAKPEGVSSSISSLDLESKPTAAMMPNPASQEDTHNCAIAIKVDGDKESVEKVKTSSMQYKVHKFMLAARSSVFATMFQSNMKESATSKVEISDMDPDVMKEMLTFIYTDRAPNLRQVHMASSLLYAADKYQLKHLKALCEQELINTIEISNAAERLILGDKCNTPQLRKVALEFVAENGGAVMKTEGWEKIRQCGGLDLVTEIMECMSETVLPKAKKARLV